MNKKKLLLLPLLLLTLIVTACSSKSSSADISGVWSANYQGGTLELVATDDSFTVDANYTKQGLFTSSEQSARMFSGDINKKSSVLIVKSINKDLLYDYEEVPDSDEDLEIPYKLSEETLTLDLEGDKIIFKKESSE